MVDVTSRLRLVVDSSGVDKSGRKLRDLRREAKRADEQARKLQSAFAGLAAVVGTAFSVQQITRAVDEYRNIENQLKLVTRSAEELRRAQEGVLQVANETGATLESTARLYGNLERFAGEFLSTQQEALDLTRAINQAAAISGASVTEASNAVRQLSQGIAGGILRAEEFNSIVENMPRLAEAIADGLGVGLGELRRQVNDGLITSQTLVESLQSQFGNLNTEFLGTARTIGQAMQGLRNILTVEIGQRFQGVQDIAVSALQAIGQNIDTLIPLVEGLGAALLIVGSRFAFTGAAAALGALLSPLGLVAAGIATIVAFRDDIAGLVTGFDNASAVVRVLASDLARVLGPVIQEISGLVGGLTERLGGLIQLGRDKTIQALSGREFDLGKQLQQLQEEQRKIDAQIQNAVAAGQEGRAARLGAASAALQKEFEQIREQRGKIIDEINRINGLSQQQGVGGYLSSVGDRARELAERLEEAEAAGGGFAGQMEKAAKATGAANDAAKKLADQAERARKATAQDQEDLRYLIERARMGREEQRIAEEVLRLRRQFGGEITDEIKELAKQNVYLEDQLKLIEEQRAQWDEIFDTLFGESSDLWRAFFDDGKQAIDSLQSLFEDLFNGIRKGDIFGSGGISIRGITGDIKQGFSDLFSGSLANTPEGRARQQAFGSFVAQASRDFLPNNGRTTSQTAGTLNSVADLAARSNPYAALAIAGGRLGIGAANAIDGNGANETTASVGQFFGFLGGLISGLVSKASSNFGRVQLDASGNIIGSEAKDRGRGDANLQRAQDFVSGISQIVGEIERITGGAAGSIQSGIQFDDRNGISVLRAGTDQAIRSFGQDVEGALAYILGRAVQGLTGGSDELVAEAKRLVTSGLTSEQFLEALDKFARRREFELDVTQRLLNATDPLLGSISQLSSNFDSLRQQAESLGVNTGPGSDLNKLLTQDLASTLEQSGVGIVELRSRFDELVSSLDGVANASDIVSQALDKVASSQRDAFNDQIQSDIGRFLDGPLDQLEALLKAQEQRLMEAKALGADLAQVERLTNLEMREFFQGLSDDALKEVESFLGLFNDATNAVVRNLDLSRQDLQSQADAFGRFAQDFANLNSSLREQFIAASPRESLDMLQDRARNLLGQVQQGNQSAAQALPQVINQLVQNARSTYGNTGQFTEILNNARNILSEAEAAALAVQSDAERQIAALDENNDILSDIRDILQSGQAVNAFFQSSANGGIASAEELLKIIQSGTGIAGAANDNATALSVTSLIGQSIQPIILPLTNSIDNFTQKLSDMPALQQLTIDAIDRGSDKVANKVEDLDDRMERVELLNKKMLVELERIAAA